MFGWLGKCFGWFRKYVRKIAVFGVEVEFHPPTETATQRSIARIKESSTETSERNHTEPAVPEGPVRALGFQEALRDLLDTAPRFFICNTNRRYSPSLEGVMRRREYAAVWEDFKWLGHMQQVQEGDAIFMWAKEVGIVGIGRAKARAESLEADNPGRLRRAEEYAGREWRIPVEWLIWVEHDRVAWPYTMPHASFVNASGENYRDLREGIRRHFLRDS